MTGWRKMLEKRNRWLLVVLSVGFASGCATVPDAPDTRFPYRSAMLNAEFDSAYPRSTEADPFNLDSRASSSSGLADSTPAEVPESRPDEPVEESQQVAAVSSPSVDNDIYNPRHSSAYIRAVYAANETQTTADGGGTDIIDIYRFTQESGTVYHSTRPAVGDLVFFHNTFDRNGDGRANDWYTHVGLVEAVDEQGNIDILSYMDERVSRTHLNLEQPNQARSDEGDVINTSMRQRMDSDPAYTQYLSSELFAGFANLLGDRTEFLVVDNWQPGMSVAQQ